MLSQGSLSPRTLHFTQGPDPATIRADEAHIEKRRHGVVQHKVFIGAGWE